MDITKSCKHFYPHLHHKKMDLLNHKDWDNSLGLLSVSMEPPTDMETLKFVLYNGNTGNFCLDYSQDEFDRERAMRSAWSADTAYYLKVIGENLLLTRWWDGYEESIPSSVIQKNPQKFYHAITKEIIPEGSIIAFAKEVFLKLRSCIQQADNGQASLRTFMYMLAALEKDVPSANEVNPEEWELQPFDKTWINPDEWTWVYDSFREGINRSGIKIKPLTKLLLRHASNRLFQEAHREATKQDFQTALFGGVTRKYDKGIGEGAFYTPTPLVRTIVQETLLALDKVQPLNSRTKIKILDPACGSAEFLREALRQLRLRNYPGEIEIVGWDISEIACEISKFVLKYENVTEWNSRIDITIEQKNSLLEHWGKQNVDLLLMNPPFISFKNLGSYKTVVKEKLTGYAKGQPDAAAVFWKNASEIINDNGVLGIVLPYSFLINETYKELREYIKSNQKIEFSLLGKLGSAGLFEKAMIVPSIQVGSKGGKHISNTVLWANYQQKSTYDSFRALRIYRLSNIPTPIDNSSYSIYEREYQNNEWPITSYQLTKLADMLKDYPTTVGKLFYIKEGILTGNNSAFILSKNALGLLPTNERKYFRPCVMGDSMRDAKLIDLWYCFYPYGKHSIPSERELIKKLPKYYNQVLKNKKSELKERRGHATKYWELNWPRTEWQLSMSPKIISAYFGKAGYFALDREGKFLVCKSFAWIPKSDELENEQFYFAYLSILHAPMIDWLLEMVCVNVAGGQFELANRYISNMPLPDLRTIDQPTLTILINIGRQIHEGVPVDKKLLNDQVANLYGINIEMIQWLNPK